MPIGPSIKNMKQNNYYQPEYQLAFDKNPTYTVTTTDASNEVHYQTDDNENLPEKSESCPFSDLLIAISRYIESKTRHPEIFDYTISVTVDSKIKKDQFAGVESTTFKYQ
jgi:hypothetical protein